jgi:hypothetical protein
MPKISTPSNSYTSTERNTFFASMHPCVKSDSICCVLNYRDRYTVGPFATNITNTVDGGGGICDASIQARDTIGLFDTKGNAALIDNFCQSVSGCSIQRISSTEIDIVLSAISIHDKFAMRSNIAGGYTLEFFVGMTYATLLPTNAISTSVSQTRIVLTITNSLMFSIATQQDYTFVKYITLSLQQNKYVVSMQHHNPFNVCNTTTLSHCLYRD